MKKALALVLALVLALSMAVSAFAVTLDELTTLKPVDPKDPDLKELTFIDLDKKVVVAGEGGTFYITLPIGTAFKDVVVTSNGAISAKVVEYDPAVYEPIDGINYSIFDKQGNRITMTEYSYEMAVDALDDMEDAVRKELVIKPLKDVVLIELVIADNYSASYKEGTLKVEAKQLIDEKWVDVSGKWTVIRDVTIFEYEEVKYAAANADRGAYLLAVKGTGYSDYVTALNGYGDKYNSAALRKDAKATVVSTTAFRAIEGKDLIVAADENQYVTIYDIAAGQKGVNFEYYGFEKMHDAAGNFLGWEFGFYGDQVVASDFVITLKPQITYYDLRESFKLKVEEDDIITYYLLKDGKVAQEITVDYMTVDLSKNIEIELKGSNTTLGQYELVLAVDAAADVEENPNTGAESVVGVVAALAVVSVATAAAVSLKK